MWHQIYCHRLCHPANHSFRFSDPYSVCLSWEIDFYSVNALNAEVRSQSLAGMLVSGACAEIWMNVWIAVYLDSHSLARINSTPFSWRSKLAEIYVCPIQEGRQSLSFICRNFFMEIPIVLSIIDLQHTPSKLEKSSAFMTPQIGGSIEIGQVDLKLAYANDKGLLWQF